MPSKCTETLDLNCKSRKKKRTQKNFSTPLIYQVTLMRLHLERHKPQGQLLDKNNYTPLVASRTVATKTDDCGVTCCPRILSFFVRFSFFMFCFVFVQHDFTRHVTEVYCLFGDHRVSMIHLKPEAHNNDIYAAYNIWNSVFN